MLKTQNTVFISEKSEFRFATCCIVLDLDTKRKENPLFIFLEKGWKRYGSYCYFIGTESKTFGDAKEDCKRSNSYLADVSNRYIYIFLQEC